MTRHSNEFFALMAEVCKPFQLHLHLMSLRFTVSKLLGVIVQTHAGLLLTECLHFAEQDFLFGSVERVTPAFFRTVSLAEVQFQCICPTERLSAIPLLQRSI